MLKNYDLRKLLTLQSDANLKGPEEVFIQKESTIYFASKACSHQNAYLVIELELLAVA